MRGLLALVALAMGIPVYRDTMPPDAEDEPTKRSERNPMLPRLRRLTWEINERGEEVVSCRM